MTQTTNPPTDVDPMTVPVVLRRELLEVGWNDKAIRRQLTSGVWTKVRHGAYLETPLWRALDEAGRHVAASRCVLRTAKTPVLLSHTTAALLLGAPSWGVPLDDVHITRTDGRIGRREAGVHQHCGAIASEDMSEHGGLPVMSATRVALEVTTLLPVEPALAVVSHLLHTRRTTLELLDARYRLHKHSLTQWPGSRTTDLVLRLADPRLESIGEVRSFHLLFRHHLPLPQLQHEVRDESGVVFAYLDFAWPELGRFIEFDGKVKYEKLLRPGERASDVVVREKERESKVCRLTGWRCLRLTWRDLEKPERTAALIRDFLYPPSAAQAA